MVAALACWALALAASAMKLSTHSTESLAVWASHSIWAAVASQGHRIKMGMFSSLERFDLVEVHHDREGSTLTSRRSNSWPATDWLRSRGISRNSETPVSSALAD